MPERENAEFRPARESSLWIVVVLVVLALAGGAVWWRWSQQQQAAPEPATPTASVPQPDIPPPSPAPVVTVPTEPENPVDTADAAALPKLDDADARVKTALTELLGGKAVASFLQVDGFVRRFVSTVDNLPRDQAAARMWPVQRTPRRFEVAGSGEAATIGPDNGARYTPLLLFVESVDTKRAVAVYAKLYPLFQEAYEEQGYPGRYFNDRLVAVIDHLLQTPEPAGPLRLKRVEIRGDDPSAPPSVRYEYADPKLESLSAGQKALIRTGLVNERRFKARLTEVRRQIAGGALAKKG